MPAEILRFPSPERPDGPKESAGLPARKPPVFETFDSGRARELMAAARRTLDGAETLLAFIHENRDLAMHAGIETLGVEVVAITEGDRFGRVIDALEDAAMNGRSAALSLDGLSVLRRLETLLAEAASNIRRFTEGDFALMEIVEARARREAEYQKAYLEIEERRMEGVRSELAAKEEASRRHADSIAVLKSALGGQRASSGARAREIQVGRPGSSDFPLWIPFVIFGAVAVAVTVVALAASRSGSKAPAMSGKPPRFS